MTELDMSVLLIALILTLILRNYWSNLMSMSWRR